MPWFTIQCSDDVFENLIQLFCYSMTPEADAVFRMLYDFSLIYDGFVLSVQYVFHPCIVFPCSFNVMLVSCPH